MEKIKKAKIDAIKATFRNWFILKWGEWDGKEGRRSTQEELAQHLDISRAAVSHYVTGRKVPEGDNLRKIAAKFGSEVYTILKIPPLPDEFSQFPPELAARLRRASEEIEALLRSGKFSPGSPEHEEAAREIFSKHGFMLKDIEIERDR